MRLIDADALISDYEDDDSMKAEFLRMALTYAPTVQPEPLVQVSEVTYSNRVKGEWSGDMSIYKCSVCGKWIDVLQGTAEMNYCPNCGADMRGGEEHER